MQIDKDVENRMVIDEEWNGFPSWREDAERERQEEEEERQDGARFEY